MTTPKRRLLLLLLALLLGAGHAAGRPADAAAGGNTSAVAINTKDGSSLFRFAFSIRRAGGEVVDNVNAAVAYASCEECQTVAISIQIVLVTGDPDVVTPENYAIAVNQQCTLCETLASAYQFVFSTGGQVHFTADGNRALAELRLAFQQLRKDAEGMTVAEIQARVAELVERLRAVLQTELVAAGRSGSAGTARGSQPSPPPAGTTTAPATTTEPGETGTEPATTETSTGPAETEPAETEPAETEPAGTTTAP